MVSEDSPLLTSTAHETIYDRFAPDQKRWIVSIVSFAGLLPMFVSSTFVPSIPQIAKNLGSTHAIVSLTVSLSILATVVGSLVWAAYSSFFSIPNYSPVDGRRSMYLWGMPFLCIGSCGVAMSTSLRSLLFWRFVQTFGCSGGIPLGAGVIGDIDKLEERGTAIGIFFGATLFGFAVAPLLGGAAAQYWSWRNLHYSIAVWGLLELFLVYFSFPETSHPGTLSIDKLKRRRWIHITWVNPLSSLWLLWSPNLFAASSLCRWRLLSAPGMVSRMRPSSGLDSSQTDWDIGAPVAGRLSDIVVKRWRKKRNGVWFPEDRLRATWIGGLVTIPLSIGASGLITTYVGGPVGLWLNLLCLYTNGMGVDFVFNPIGSYNVDVAHSRSAEATAASASVSMI
ncbi:major facilitator superfamily domain-containing protein [Suillus subluteus]|nr:major facilitator superfamily domain-containing protein [Suillus subluteus]